jgi:NTE family protein
VQLALACRASAAIPVIYEPVILGDAILFDGGMVNNMPGDILTADEVPRIAIDLVSDQSVMAPKDYSLLAAAPRFIDMLLASSEDAHISDGKASGVHVVSVDTGFASSLDRSMPIETRARLFDVGYLSTWWALRDLSPSAAPQADAPVH